jgi:hypothetical protein
VKLFLIYLFFSTHLFAVDLQTAQQLNSQAQLLFSESLNLHGYSKLEFNLNHEETLNLGGAEKQGDTAIISIGESTLESLSIENFLFIYCHELGHFLGGKPKKTNGWASTEVQSDYWSAQVCLPQMTDLKNQVYTDFIHLKAPLFFEFLAQSIGMNLIEMPFYQKPSIDRTEIKVFDSEYVSFQCRFDILRAGAKSAPYPACASQSLHRH